MKTKAFRIIVDLILIILGIVFLVFGIKDAVNTFGKRPMEDNIKFSKSYTNVSTNNVYKYIGSIEEINTGIVFVGNPLDAWSQVLASALEVAVKNNYEVIYYLEQDTDIPQIVVIKDGKTFTYKKAEIIDSGYDDAPISYFTEERLNQLKTLITK